MKKIKSLLCVVLSVAMALCLIACAADDVPESNNPSESPSGNNAEQATTNVADDITTETDEIGVVTIRTPASDSFVRATKEKNLVVGIVDNAAGTLDPALTESIGAYPVFDQLFRVDDDGNIVGELVESYKYLDEEHTQLELKIREGVMFSDGTELTAEDVLYSLDRFDDVGSSYVYWSGINFEESYAADKYTAVLVNDQPHGALMAYMTTFRSSVVSKAWAEGANDEDWWDAAVGSGPYTCVENIAGSHTTFAARSDYWGGTPEFETITVKYYTEQTTMMVDYENGVIDCCYDLSASNIKRIMNGEVSNSTLMLDPTIYTYTILLPQKAEEGSPTHNELFRKAFIECIDMEALGIAVADDLFVVADTLITAKSNMDTTASFTHVYDPEQAKADLEAAGYKPGEVTMTLTIESATGYSEMAEAIQAYAAEIGINVVITEADVPTLIGNLMSCADDFLINKMSDQIGDPDAYYDFVADFSTALQVSYSDEVFNTNCMAARTSVFDREERAELYSEAWQSLYDQYYAIPAINTYYGYVARDYISSATMPTYNYIDVTRITCE